MASVSTDAQGRRRILFVDADGRRRSIRLGVVPVKLAQSLKLRVEAILSFKGTKHPFDAELAGWIGSLPDTMHERLAAAGLVEPREKAEVVTLGPMLAVVFNGVEVRPGTLVIYSGVRASLESYFGATRPVATISVADAETWRQSLVADGLATATVNKRVKVARNLFKRAADLELISRNVFAKLRSGSQANPERQHYIGRETLDKVLAACPSAQWRCIFALARLAGLRVPSELAGLMWQHVDFDGGRLLVHSPKTSGCGKASRSVPIDPQLKAILLEAFTEAPEGATHIIADPRHRETAANLRTTALRILERASVPAWPKLFNNLRASCATDWSRVLPAKACGEFLGHTAAVALQHYHQTRPEDFTLIIGGGAESGARAAQNAAQHPSARDGKVSQPRPQVSAAASVTRPGAEPCELVQAAGMTPTSWAEGDGDGGGLVTLCEVATARKCCRGRGLRDGSRNSPDTVNRALSSADAHDGRAPAWRSLEVSMLARSSSTRAAFRGSVSTAGPTVSIARRT